MRLFFYYAVHTFKNQLKKIFKSWVIIFMLACMLFGGIAGFIGASIGRMAEDRQEEAEETAPAEEILPEEEEKPADDGMVHSFFGYELPDGGVSKIALLELAIGAVILLVLVMEALSANSSGAKIFQPADVNLLFPSPMKPQNVLMFRLVTKAGILILLTLYMFIQMPNLTMNLGLSVPGAVSIIVSWGILLIFSMLMQALLYAGTATYENEKSRISMTVYVLLGALAAAFLVYYMTSGQKLISAAISFFNSPASRFVPVIGWLKGFSMYVIEGNYPMAALMLGLMLLSCAALLLAISRMKVDFYEDAMAKSEETAELVREAKESGAMFVRRRKKDRSESLERDGMKHGSGANVFFWKTVYNRHRFAKLRYFTGTSFTYLAISAIACLILYFAGEKLPFDRFTIIPLIMTVVAFYRSLGNPLDQDIKVDYFRMIPESSFRKLMFSLLGGSYNTLLDILPGFLLAALVLRPAVWMLPLWILFVLSIDAYSTTVATFIDLVVPKHSGKMVSQFIQIMFLYFGLGPVAAVIAVTLVMGVLPIGLIIASAANLGLAALFIFLAAVRLSPGH